MARSKYKQKQAIMKSQKYSKIKEQKYSKLECLTNKQKKKITRKMKEVRKLVLNHFGVDIQFPVFKN